MRPPHAAAAPPLELCAPALALRALLLVQGVLLLGVGVSAGGWAVALAMLGPAAAVGLAGTLMWLVAACALQRRLARWTAPQRLGTLALLGAATALLAWGLLVVFALVDGSLPRPLAVAGAGAVLAWLLGLWLDARGRARQPADAHARLAELQSRIRPHFLFNTLNTALALVQVDPARAEAVLEDLAELFRVALTEPGAAVTLADEAALTQRYLAIEQIRFGDRLRVHWQLDAQAAAVRVPPLLLQPLVENAVRHGVEPAAAGGEIFIDTRVRRAQVELTIRNSLPEHASAPGHGIALSNVRERLRLLHDVAAEFEAGREGAQFVVRIMLPLE